MLGADRHEQHYAEATGRWWDQDVQPEVAQAVGMVAEQLRVDVVDAALLLRAHGAAHGRCPLEVAMQVLDQDFRFAS